MPRIALIVAFCAATSPAFAQDADDGRALYQTHCATCHGLEGGGDGPMAGVLLIKPPNLQELTKRNDGAFPLERVVKRIDGRDPLVSHGSPMPVYGDYFETDMEVPMKAPSGQPILTSQPVVDIVAYLRSIQSGG